jgi:hypothetical protein
LDDNDKEDENKEDELLGIDLVGLFWVTLAGILGVSKFQNNPQKNPQKKSEQFNWIKRQTLQQNC